MRHVTVGCEDHVACPIGDAGILVRHCIVQELPDTLECLLGGVCLLGGKGTECREHGTVHGSGIVEEHSTATGNIVVAIVRKDKL